MRFKFDSSKLGKKIGEGEGEYGTLHEYDDQGAGKARYLVKCIPAKDHESQMQFIEEFLIGSNNKHSFVLNYKSIDIHEANQDGCKYMVYIKMKAHKQNLKKLLREMKNKGYLPLERVILIFYSLASALAYLEGEGIVHSNITHDSVLFSKNGTVKLGGYAFSKKKPWKNHQKRKYQSYRPPERLRNKSPEGKSLAFKSDVWCLAKLVIDICLLQDELRWQNTGEKTYERIKADLKQVENIYHDKKLIKILKALLNPKPEKRPSFGDIRDELQVAYEDFGLFEMENVEEEEPNLNDSHVSDIQHARGDQSEISFPQSVQDVPFQENYGSILEELEEEEEKIEEQIVLVQDEVQRLIEDLRKTLKESFDKIQEKWERVMKYRVDETQTSKQNLNKFLIETKELLTTFKSSVHRSEVKDKKLRAYSKTLKVSQNPAEASESEKLINEGTADQMDDPIYALNSANKSSLTEQEILHTGQTGINMMNTTNPFDVGLNTLNGTNGDKTIDSA